MATIKLTAKKLEKLKATGTQTDYFDQGAHVPGFGIRVSAAGRRVWFLLYRVNGKLKRHTIGTNPPMGLEAARTAAGRQLLGVQVEDYFVVDLFADSRIHRASGRLRAELTRRLHLDRFTLELGASLGPYRARGQVVGDTLLRLIVSTDGVAADTQLVRLASPVLLPTAVPLALVLGERPRVGDHHQFAIFDPLSMSASDVAVRVLAESVFVVADSARPDSSSGTWVSALDDTLREGTAFAPFHWGGREAANLLTNPALDPVSRMPEFKLAAVRIAGVVKGTP